MTKRLLILGGIGEAAELALKAKEACGDTLDVISSLAGRLQSRPDIAGEVRVGGFGGGRGLAEYIQREHIDLLIDATHPFAQGISETAYDASILTQTPRLILTRPSWQLPPNAKWLEADNFEDAARLVGDISRCAFLTTGRGNIDAFSNIRNVRFVVRLIEPPDKPLPLTDADIVIGRPPFSVEDERQLIRDYEIDTLVTKNSGGEKTTAKLTAALDEDIRIILIRRPPPEPGEITSTVTDALKWIQGRL